MPLMGDRVVPRTRLRRGASDSPRSDRRRHPNATKKRRALEHSASQTVQNTAKSGKVQQCRLTVVTAHGQDRFLRNHKDACQSGWKSSTTFSDGSRQRICLPPGPSIISFLNCTPFCFSRATSDSISSTEITIRFHPPGVGLAPSGIAREPED